MRNKNKDKNTEKKDPVLELYDSVFTKLEQGMHLLEDKQSTIGAKLPIRVDDETVYMTSPEEQFPPAVRENGKGGHRCDKVIYCNRVLCGSFQRNGTQDPAEAGGKNNQRTGTGAGNCFCAGPFFRVRPARTFLISGIVLQPEKYFLSWRETNLIGRNSFCEGV